MFRSTGLRQREYTIEQQQFYMGLQSAEQLTLQTGEQLWYLVPATKYLLQQDFLAGLQSGQILSLQTGEQLVYKVRTI